MQLYEERGKRGRSRARARGESRGRRSRGEGEEQEKEGAQLEVSTGKQNSGILQNSLGMGNIQRKIKQSRLNPFSGTGLCPRKTSAFQNIENSPTHTDGEREGEETS